MNVNLYVIEDYRKNDDFAVRINKPNSNPIFLRTKTNATLFAAKDYENDTTLRPKKTNPNKPNFKSPNWRARSNLLKISRLAARILHCLEIVSISAGQSARFGGLFPCSSRALRRFASRFLFPFLLASRPVQNDSRLCTARVR